MRFVIYNDDGKILRVGNCPANDVQKQAHGDHVLTVGTAAVDDMVHKVKNGKIVRKKIPDKPPKDEIATKETTGAEKVPKVLQDILNRLSKLETEA